MRSYFFLGVQLSLFGMVFSPLFPPRAQFPIVILHLLPALLLYANIDFKRIIPFVLSCFYICFLSVAGSYTHSKDFRIFQFLSREDSKREKIIIDHKQKGDDSVVIFEKIILPEKYEYLDFEVVWKDLYKHEIQIK